MHVDSKIFSVFFTLFRSPSADFIIHLPVRFLTVIIRMISTIFSIEFENDFNFNFKPGVQLYVNVRMQ